MQNMLIHMDWGEAYLTVFNIINVLSTCAYSTQIGKGLFSTHACHENK
ncbi:MAG: hypothetical protein L6302_06265 [Desulfobacteraceae bacterium]|nr:hypothetical protein [Desulfobacteraceae bacterium]